MNRRAFTTCIFASAAAGLGVTGVVMGRVPASPAASVAASPEASPIASPVVIDEADGGFFSSAVRTDADSLERYVWSTDADTVTGSVLRPASFTLGNVESSMWGQSVHIIAEFVNTSNAPVLAPNLLIDAQLGGKSFGVQRVFSSQYLVAPGGSALYEGNAVYGGAVLLGDWDELIVSLEPAVEWGAEFDVSTLRLEISENKIYNDGTSDVESLTGVTVWAIVRDNDGQFVGLCMEGTIQSAVPAGLFVRIPDSMSLTSGSIVPCSEAGLAFAEALGTNPCSVEDWLLTIAKP